MNGFVSVFIFIMCDWCNVFVLIVYCWWVMLCILCWYGRGRVIIVVCVMFLILYGNWCWLFRGKFVMCCLIFINKNVVIMLK